MLQRPVKKFVVSKAAQKIEFNDITGTVYGDGPLTLTATASSGLEVSYAVLSGLGELSGNQLTISGAGDIVVEASQAEKRKFRRS